MSDAKIIVQPTGSYRVEGGISLYDREGNPIPVPSDGRPYFLCRCGSSGTKPFCDGAHQRCEWDPTLNPPDRSAGTSSAPSPKG